MKKFLSYCAVCIFVFLCACAPNKTEYAWHLKYVCAPQAWSKTQGANVTVAVIDSGIRYDLLGETFDRNRIVASCNTYDGNDDLSDFTSHGTAMVSLIGSNGENGFYGIAPKCRFIIVKALNGLGQTNAAALIAGIEFSLENGADIINLSLGSHNPNEQVEQAIQKAYDKNVPVVCAAGDQKEENVLFPARLQTTLSVAAVDRLGALYAESNYGNGIDVRAPGVKISIPCTDYEHGVGERKKSGSSVATAIFSGVLALYLDTCGEYKVEDVYAFFRQAETLNLKNIL